MRLSHDNKLYCELIDLPLLIYSGKTQTDSART